MPTPRQPMPNSHCAMFSEDSTCFYIFPVSWVASWSPTSSLQCRLACLFTSRSGFSTSWRGANSSTSTMQYGNLCLLTTTSHQQLSHMKEVSQRNGKEMKEMSWYLLGDVTQSLPGASPAQHPIFNHSIECTWAILEFSMYAWYKSHDEATLS